MGLQRVGHDWMTEVEWEIKLTKKKKKNLNCCSRPSTPLANVATQVYDKPPDIQGPLPCAHPTSPSEDWMPHVRVRSESHLNRANLALLVPGVRRPITVELKARHSTLYPWTSGYTIFLFKPCMNNLIESSILLLNRIIHVFSAIFHLLLF